MNQTIYFRKDIWKDFEKETSKSDLVNELLATHYKKVKLGGYTKPNVSPSPPKTKAAICKEHGMDKQFCANMKHKAKP